MDQRVQVFLILIFAPFFILANHETSNEDVTGLKSLMALWTNTPPNWETLLDPCEDHWDGIGCTNARVVSIKLSSMNLSGSLSGDIQQFIELETLDLSYNKLLTGPLPPEIGSLPKLTDLILVGCGFSGRIPLTIGNLQKLVFLSLNSNRFSGSIPSSIGNLSALYWLDLADNNLEGTIPVSSGSIPGLDMLSHCKHFHLGMNKLSGPIPPKLFNSNMKLIHVLFESNKLTGSIPSSVGLVKSLEVVRFDSNMLSGPIPENLTNLPSVSRLFLSNNKLSGPAPDLMYMSSLHYVDLSNNSFDVSDVPPWFSTLQTLTTLVMENTQLQGAIPTGLFSLPNLQTVVLKNNRLNGTLNIDVREKSQLEFIDLENNLISAYEGDGGYNDTLILVKNPICSETGVVMNYCKVSQSPDAKPYKTPSNNCVSSHCTTDQVSSPNCKCGYPYDGTLIFRAPSFSDLGNKTHYNDLENNLTRSFLSHQLSVDSVALSNLTEDSLSYLRLRLQVFPLSQDRFSRKDISGIAFLLSNQTFKPLPYFGPFYFIGDVYEHFEEQKTVASKSKKSSNSIIIVGAAAGGTVLVIILLLVGVYAIRRRRRTKGPPDQNNPFGKWDVNRSSGSIPQLKGARSFSFEELMKYSNNFSDGNDVGSGGYGKVYRGVLPGGQLIAIKRAHKESIQGGHEFKTEIELLSRVHHMNLVSLVGFCFDREEEMLVYEYVANGTLKDALSGKSGIRLDWKRRLKIALGTARGLAYLHELCDPPIIHRDIKSTNVLLDNNLTPKVADFGLCKSVSEGGRSHVSTQVKGTMGYLDPEYYMTQRLTEKSDVYGFGVLLLEILTARRPIEQGKYIVREVRISMDKTKDLYNLHQILDPTIGLGTTLKGLERFVDLAMLCVAEEGVNRPTMSEVVKEIEYIMQLAGLNSASTSLSYEEPSSNKHPYGSYSSDGFDYSGGVIPPSKIEPHFYTTTSTPYQINHARSQPSKSSSLTRLSLDSRTKPKIAFLFLTNSDLHLAPLWQSFFSKTTPNLYSIYIHADPSLNITVPSGVFQNRFIAAKRTYRASPTLIYATRRLLPTAVLDDPANTFFAVLSQYCAPLHSFRYVYRSLFADPNFDRSESNSQSGRVFKYRSFIEILSKSTHLWKRYAARGRFAMMPEVSFDQFRVGSQFFLLTRRHAVVVLKDRQLWKKFRLPCYREDECYPEEHYFPTLLSMADPDGCTHYTLTRVNWTGTVNGHPYTYKPSQVSADLISRLRQSNFSESYLFARKFTPECLKPLMALSEKVIFRD